MMTLDVLVVEDDPEFADYLRRGLTYDGYSVRITSSAEAGLEEIERNKPDLIIFDVMLPGMNGFAACRHVRESGFAGSVLVLTARSSLDDRITGLDSGADDYLAKPFQFEELLARLRALLRRSNPRTSVIKFADVELDSRAHSVTRRNSNVGLTRTEFDLLQFFMLHPEQTLKRSVLIRHIWGTEADFKSNVIDIYVSRLRQKLGEPNLIHTVYGVGYLLKK